MAFEYFMAYCLLEGKLSQFMNHLHLMKYFNYPKMPRHFEEAILVFVRLAGREDVGLKVSEETMRKFADFNRIFEKYDRNKMQARAELEKKYKDTYWFYAFYYYKAKE